MDEAQKRKAKITRIYNTTVRNMEVLGTFKKEFESAVRRYSELRVQYDILTDKWYDAGCEITEEYTNKSGATNQRKTALYLAMETMRRELIDMENIFGLTPKGLKAIKTKGLEKAKKSAMDRLLDG